MFCAYQVEVSLRQPFARRVEEFRTDIGPLLFVVQTEDPIACQAMVRHFAWFPQGPEHTVPQRK